MKMPIMDGWEFCRQLEGKDHPPIAVLTAAADPAERARRGERRRMGTQAVQTGRGARGRETVFARRYVQHHTGLRGAAPVRSAHVESPRDRELAVSAAARRQSGRVVAVGRRSLCGGEAADKPVFVSIGYAACHWCHVMAHESFEDAATREADERAVRQHQGRSRGAPRCRHDLHERDPGDGRGRRLAALGVLLARRSAVLPRHVLPEGAAVRSAELHGSAARDGRRVQARAAPTPRTTRSRWSTACSASTSTIAAAREMGQVGKLDASLLIAAGQAARRALRSEARRARRRAEVSVELEPRSARARRAGFRSATPRASAFDALGARHGRGRHLRSSRRRLRALLGRREVARAALREDALRPGAAARHLRERRRDGRPVRAARRGGDRRDGRVPRARAVRLRRRAVVVARRRQRRRGGQVLRVDAGAAARGARAGERARVRRTRTA